MQTIVLLLLRKLYFQKSQELQDTEFIHITLGELHGEIEATGIYNERLKKTELKINLVAFLVLVDGRAHWLVCLEKIFVGIECAAFFA